MHSAISVLLACGLAAGCAPVHSTAAPVDGGADGGDRNDGGAGARLEFCDGVEDDPAGPTAASSLQRCIDNAADGGVVELQPMTLRTATLGGNTRACTAPGIVCAQLQAAADFSADGGLLALGATEQVQLDHLILDGNRSARFGSAAARSCLAGDGRFGENAASNGCSDCGFTYSASMNALCGSGLDWVGDGAKITDSIFQDNGGGDAGYTADGLTLRRSDGAQVLDDIFVDNSAVALSVGGARAGHISNNQIRQVRSSAVAGIWLRGPGGASTGDLTQALVFGNSIDCGVQLCDFGIAIGSHAWNSNAANTEGAMVTANSVVGAKLGILAEGAGTAAAPLMIEFNSVTRSVSSAQFACGVRPSFAIDLSPDSVIDAGTDTSATSSEVFHDCP
jgi:hypothetical protein